jgi:transglutaminase-like putative cysteine protease
MRILSEFDIQFHLPSSTTMVALLGLHPSVDPYVIRPDHLLVEHVDANTTTTITPVQYIDSFGNRCSRFVAPAGAIRLSGNNIIEIAGLPDQIEPNALQANVEDLPTDTLQFLLASRYCQVDQMSNIANDLFSFTTPGWARAIFIRDWVHNHVTFNYKAARPTKTALDVFTERVGVCRDFQHLAITLTRAMNIPARYVTGQLGDIRIPFSGPGDFSAWYEVFLDGRWWTMDARHNTQRIGRILMATGRDATDVALTTSFGIANLTHFYVESNEVDDAGNKVPLPPPLAQFNSPLESSAGTEASPGVQTTNA